MLFQLPRTLPHQLFPHVSAEMSAIEVPFIYYSTLPPSQLFAMLYYLPIYLSIPWDGKFHEDKMCICFVQATSPVPSTVPETKKAFKNFIKCIKHILITSKVSQHKWKHLGDRILGSFLFYITYCYKLLGLAFVLPQVFLLIGQIIILEEWITLKATSVKLC